MFTPYSGSANLNVWLDTKNTSSYQSVFGKTKWLDLSPSGSYVTMSTAVEMNDTGSGFDFTANYGIGNVLPTNLSGSAAYGNIPNPFAAGNVWYDGTNTVPFAWEAIFTIATASNGLQATSITSLFGNRRNSTFVFGFRSQSAAIPNEGIWPQTREDDTSITSSLSLTPGIQYHLIVAASGSGPGVGRRFRFYYEYSGSQFQADSTNPIAMGDLNPGNTDVYWNIAAELVSGYNFTGYIRMLRVWTKHLSEQDISDLFAFEDVSGTRNTGSADVPRVWVLGEYPVVGGQTFETRRKPVA